MDVLLVIIAIVAVLSGFLKDRSDTGSGKQKRTFNRPNPSPTPSGGNDRSGGMVSDKQEQSEVNASSIEEQQQEQRKRLSDRMNTATQVEMGKRKHDAIIGGMKKVSEKDISAKQRQLKKRIKSNLNQKGLVNGIIMAEVLGTSRAGKPYQSILKQRRK